MLPLSSPSQTMASVTKVTAMAQPKTIRPRRRLRRLPTGVMAVLGLVLVVLGYWFRTFQVEAAWLFPLGLTAPGFSSSDYFPLLPHLGWFLLGAVLGRTAYREKQTLLPRVNAQAAPIRFFSWCGRMSLFLYLGHQPVLYALVSAIAALRG